MTQLKPRTTVLALIGAVFAASSASADTVINDNLVVIGNACVGQDCVNNYPFAGDLLVMEENNVRIAFGAAGQFRLTANDSANGGPSEFRIDAIQPTAVLTDQSAIAQGGLVALPGATIDGNGNLVVPLDELASNARLTNPNVSGEATVTFTPGQTVVIQAGDFSAFGGPVFDITPNSSLTSLTNPGGISAQVSNNPARLVSFSETGNMVTLGINSEDVAGAMSVGSATNLRQVTGVADAVAADDVINVGQLMRALPSLGFDIADEIRSETSRLNGVSATTAAMSALQPNPRAQAPLSLSLGLGTYEGETAAAMGLLWRMSDTSHMQFSVAGSDQTTPQTAISFRIVW
ncbi:YadA C-terminal domain-containing protein [Jannaschia sp. CCS1]|uniref:YadA C-terminal domain-containing protein n=1 Tax=Jannaschia sp. (strain CCS1) TaxID=290400 RepID=UPI000053A2AF|nr:YadA C-terminal domain-containing protein [Jannaschia sp. CCS1]ABD54941.1 hypothetical protein Jann_2024 [Jannaschia sp. CCS1]